MITLHRSPWVLPISSPAITDGAILVDDEQILKVGRFADVRTESFDEIVEHEGRILMPGLINAHCHLELSPYAELSNQSVEPGNMPAWISSLLDLRSKETGDGVDGNSCQIALTDQYVDGVGLVLDIGNASSLPVAPVEGVEVQYFRELLGLSKQATDFGFQTLGEVDPDHLVTAHAPYSTSSTLLQAVKRRAHKENQLYPIHVAESDDEIEFLKTGKGRFRSFLEERGVWDGSFAAPGTGSVSYLDQLGVIDEKTLCVHCVHLDDEEILLLSKKNAKVCLCPGSNRFLGVGRAPIEKMLEAGLKPCLGTDSLASNPDLSIWREMTIVAEENPGLEPEIIVAMATQYGAEAISDTKRGKLATGCSSRFLSVGYDGQEPFDFLTLSNDVKDIVWV